LIVPVALAAVAGSAVTCAAVIALPLPALARAVPRLVGVAVGVLLAVSFLDLLPAALERGAGVAVLASLLGGLVLFFVLEKAQLWRHSHADVSHDHAMPSRHDGAARGAGHVSGHRHAQTTDRAILLGNCVHNLIDGILLAAGFLADSQLGFAMTMAVIAHQLPQQIGDWQVLQRQGKFSRALAWNVTAGLVAMLGGVLGCLLLAPAPRLVPHVLALAAASFIYTAMADLIPGMHRHWDVRATVSQMTLIGAGIAAIAGLHQLQTI